MSGPDEQLLHGVRRDLVVRGEQRAGAGRADVAAALGQAGAWGSRRLLDAVDDVTAELTGAGPLQPLLDDPDVTDVPVSYTHLTLPTICSV